MQIKYLIAKLIQVLLSRKAITNQQNNSVTIINVNIDMNDNDKH